MSHFSRRWFFLNGTWLAGVFSLSALTMAQDRNPTVKETLEKQLRCRRPVEFEFVAIVVQHVEQGNLPLPVVYTCMKWALKRRGDIPFPYFENALREVAKKNYGLQL